MPPDPPSLASQLCCSHLPLAFVTPILAVGPQTALADIFKTYLPIGTLFSFSKCNPETAQRLFPEVNERLQQAVKENNMGEMSVVSALMEVAQKKIDEASKKLEDCRKEREVVDSKRKKNNGSDTRKKKVKWRQAHFYSFTLP